jgi:hypothetical protein
MLKPFCVQNSRPSFRYLLLDEDKELLHLAYNLSFSAYFLVRTIFFSHNKSANRIFQPSYRHIRTRPAPSAAATEPPVVARPAATDAAAAHRVGRECAAPCSTSAEDEQAHAWFQRPPDTDPTRPMQNSTATAHVRFSTPSGHRLLRISFDSTARRPQSAPATPTAPAWPSPALSSYAFPSNPQVTRALAPTADAEPFTSPRAPLPTQVLQPFDPRAPRATAREVRLLAVSSYSGVRTPQ